MLVWTVLALSAWSSCLQTMRWLMEGFSHVCIFVSRCRWALVYSGLGDSTLIDDSGREPWGSFTLSVISDSWNYSLLCPTDDHKCSYMFWDWFQNYYAKSWLVTVRSLLCRGEISSAHCSKHIHFRCCSWLQMTYYTLGLSNSLHHLINIFLKQF